MKEFYVSNIGSDSNLGTKDFPLKTIQGAKDAVNRLKSQLADNMCIILCDKEIILDNTICFAKNDELPFGKTLTIKPLNGINTLISGGIKITNWEKEILNSLEVYKAYIPEIDYARDFYVNNEPRNLAKTGWIEWDYVEGSNSGTIKVGFAPKITTKENMQSEQYKNAFGPFFEDVLVGGDSIDFSTIHNIEQLEFSATAEWRFFIARAKKVVDANSVVMSHAFRPISSHVENDYGENDPRWKFYPNPRNKNAKGLCYFQNDISLIKNEGDFVFDEKSHTLYYYPKRGEKLEELNCFVPRIESIFRFEGEKNSTLKNIILEGLTFSHCDCSWYTKKGLATDQAFMLYRDYYFEDGNSWLGGYKCEQLDVSMLVINYCENIKLRNCIFENSVGYAILSSTLVKDILIEKSIFRNIGDSAIILKTADHCNIQNNIINSCCRVNFAGVGVIVEDPVSTNIMHNDISNLPYSGISVGWGWGGKIKVVARDNSVCFNKIHNIMNKLRDGGGIYGLDKQPNSRWNGNYIKDIMNDFACYLYFDQGCSEMEAKNNVLELHPNYKKTGIFCANVMEGVYPATNHNIVFSDNYINIPIEEASTSVKSQDIKGNELSNMILNTYSEPKVVKSDDWSDNARAIIEKAGITSENILLLENMFTNNFKRGDFI